MTTHSLPQTTTLTQAQPWTVVNVAVANYTPASPAEISPATSLTDLRTIKETWLAQAEALDDYTTLATVARELGNPVNRMLVRTVEGDFPGCTIIVGLSRTLNGTHDRYLAVADIQIYYEETTGIDPLRRKYTSIANVHILRNGQYLARFSQTVAEPHQTQADLIIPGPWLQTLRDLLPQAEAAAITRYQAALEAERQALLAELLIPTQTASSSNQQSAISNQQSTISNQQSPTPSANPFIVDGLEITRLDFFLNDDGTCIVQKLARTPLSGDRYVVLAQETKPLNLNKTLAYLHQHGYCTREWEAVSTPTFKKPAGMRAWKGTEPHPIRTEGQIRKLRAELTSHAPGLGHALNLALDL